MIGPVAPRVEEAAEPVHECPFSPAARFGGVGRWLRGLSRGQRVVGVVIVLALIALVGGGRSLDLDEFHAWTKRLPAAGVAAVVALLPLVGFPVSALHLAAGLRFEFWVALAIVAAATLTQHVACWLLAKALPRRFFSPLDPWKKKLAGTGFRQAAVLCCLLPGMPYTVQLYLLPVMGAPLRVLCLISVPLHTTRATVTILLGAISDNLTPGRVVALAVYYATIFTICAFALRRLRKAIAGGDGADAEALG
jgi:uncharacterized membrane protein YdjX (TVP38/TMEM64 family)